MSDVQAGAEASAVAAGPGYFRQRCEVTGFTRAHGGGALRSSLTQEECVWHRHRITRQYEEAYEDGGGNHRQQSRTDVLSDFTSASAFLVEDATGTIVVRPGVRAVDGAEKVLDVFAPHDMSGRAGLGPVSFQDGTTRGYRREEWLVRPGVRIFVHGEASDDSGVLAVGVPAENGTFLLSTRSETAVTRGEDMRTVLFGVATAVTGLVCVIVTLHMLL
ncbi:GIDE domain-containing protein [Streptomyces sp. NPDC093223]|uniref:GIDE domain-containing protein n=1 Tax=Streptomyces sp. NPDC093223 TaxID=3366033 RepID=UPI0037F8EB84